MESQHIFELLKTGGIIAGVLLTLGIFIVLFRYVLPLIRPTNGAANGTLLAALQQLAELPSEVKVLSTEIRTLREHVYTKAELMEEFSRNRHDIASALTEPIATLSLAVKEVVDIVRHSPAHSGGPRRRRSDKDKKSPK